ncbi:phospholipase D-like domain-containing protein [Candidatus Lokiarchaeum ossiferum]|uniref:phospholipase D-like domain-containing protein n=1 Tax=Candidatus Lokiarchaeum ossiferum TaxID=2951803 RepID=UPI00352D4B36
MVRFLTTSGVSTTIETIIRKAKKKLILVSPYLQLSNIFFERLLSADKKGVEIIFIYGKSNLKKDEEEKIFSLKNIEVYFYETLHAKCYCNEEQMVISSMNLHEFSQTNNREMGIGITKSVGSQDQTVYQDALEEILEIKENAVLIHPNNHFQNTSTERKKEQKNNIRIMSSDGFCIRCREMIPLNAEKPYCYDCYNTWKRFKNPEYEESFCHLCGLEESSTIIKPFCYKCFKQLH